MIFYYFSVLAVLRINVSKIYYYFMAFKSYSYFSDQPNKMCLCNDFQGETAPSNGHLNHIILLFHFQVLKKLLQK